MPPQPLLLNNIGQLVTLAPLVQKKRLTAISRGDLGIVKNAWLATDGKKIIGYGSQDTSPSPGTFQEIDCRGSVVLPGLIDCHTHPVFDRSRDDEFCLKLSGKTYQEIAASGGGILATVQRTRSLSNKNLQNLVLQRLQNMFETGVTFAEVKSGYGLSVDEELRHLRILNQLKSEAPLGISITCLALHAVPPEFKTAKEWGTTCTKYLLPVIKEEGLCQAVDAFIENGYFLASDVEDFFVASKKFGFDIRLHADEFSDAHAAHFAAKIGAKSADHLQCSSRGGLKAMAKADVIAVLLPGTSAFSKIPYTDAGPMREAGLEMAVATDFNPGSCTIYNLRLAMTLAAIHCKLTPEEAIASITAVPAKSLGVMGTKGHLSVGADQDILVLPLDSVESVVSDFGQSKPLMVLRANGPQ
jgi:imidazolonepropionase